MIEALTEEMMASNLTQWIQATYWLWPILEIFHFFGLTLLMGGLIIVDLRMIGFFSDIGLEEVKKLFNRGHVMSEFKKKNDRFISLMAKDLAVVVMETRSVVPAMNYSHPARQADISYNQVMKQYALSKNPHMSS